MSHIHGTRAAAFIWAGMLIIGGADNLMPLISPTSSLWSFHALRSGMVLVLLLGVATAQGWQVWPNRFWRVSARNFFSAMSMFIYFGALAFVPIGVAVAGLFTAPVFVLLFSALFRSETVGWVRWIAVAVGFAGALLVIQPDDGSLALASFVPILGGVFYAIGALATRSWCEGEGTVPMLVNYYIVIAIGGLFGVLWFTFWPVEAPAGADGFVSRGWVTPVGLVWLWFVLQSVTSVFGVGCLTKGYQLGEATYVAINEYSLILFATFFAWMFWGQMPGPIALMGMALIIGAGVVITLRAKREVNDTLQPRIEVSQKNRRVSVG